MPVIRKYDENRKYDISKDERYDRITYTEMAGVYGGRLVDEQIDGKGMSLDERISWEKEHAAEMVQIVTETDRLGYLPVDGSKFTDDLNRIGKAINPNYKPLSANERKERKAISEAIQKKFSELALYNSMNGTVFFAGTGCPREDRTLLYAGSTEEIIEKNRVLSEKLRDPNRRNQAINDRINEMLDVDLGAVDLRDPKSVLEHMDELRDIIFIGPELRGYQNVINGVEDYDRFAKLNAFYNAGAYIRAALDIYTSPLQENMRLEELDALGESMSTFDLEGDFGSVIRPDVIPDESERESINSLFMQVATLHTPPFGNLILADKTKTPRERSETYLREFYANYQSGKDLTLGANERGLHSSFYRNVNAEKKAITEKIPEYREKLLRNIEVLKANDPTLTVTQDQIDAMFSPERIAIVAEGRVLNREMLSQMKSRPTDKAIPKNLGRAMQSSLLIRTTDDRNADAVRSELLDMLNDPSPEGAEKRRQYIVDQINSINEIPKDSYDVTKSITETGPAVLDNMQKGAFAWVMKDVRGGMYEQLGLDEKASISSELDHYTNKGQAVGGAISEIGELMSSEEFFTIPLDAMTGEQEMTAYGILEGNRGLVDGAFLGRLALHSHMKSEQEQGRFGFDETHEFKKITTDDFAYGVFKDIVKNGKEGDPFAFNKTENPEKAFLDRLVELQKDLKKENKWFNFNNSKEFETLNSRLNGVVESLKKGDTSIDPNGKFSVSNGQLKELLDSINQYDRHVAKADKDRVKSKKPESRSDVRRHARLEIAKKVKTSITSFQNAMDELRARDRFDAGVAQETKEARNADPEMQLFEKGITRTDAMEKSLDSKSGCEKLLYERMINARQELANQSGRAEPNGEIVHGQVAEVLTAQLMLNQVDALEASMAVGGKEAFENTFAKMKETIAKNQELREITRNMSGHDVNEFLAGPGEHAVTMKLTASMEKERKEKLNNPERTSVKERDAKNPEKEAVSFLK